MMPMGCTWQSRNKTKHQKKNYFKRRKKKKTGYNITIPTWLQFVLFLGSYHRSLWVGGGIFRWPMVAGCGKGHVGYSI